MKVRKGSEAMKSKMALTAKPSSSSQSLVHEFQSDEAAPAPAAEAAAPEDCLLEGRPETAGLLPLLPELLLPTLGDTTAAGGLILATANTEVPASHESPKCEREQT